jgi:hypothetical protein
MSLRNLLTRLFSRRPLAGISTADTARDEITRRARARAHHPISVACAANGLTSRERTAVFAHFEDVSRAAGMSEALTQARNMAAKLGNQRRVRNQRHDDWMPPAAA